MPATPATARRSAADLLALGFGSAVLMWAIGYFCRLFGDAVPAPFLFVAMTTFLLAGGWLAGAKTDRGVFGGIQVGLIAGLINLLIIGSLVGGSSPRDVQMGALLWVPGTLLASALVGGLGAAIGRLAHVPGAQRPDWPAWYAMVAPVATFVLLAAGGLVTGFDAGLAVVDWPNSEGYLMVLYPLSRMTGGVYLEHSHRLLGMLVGLTTLVLAIHIQRHDHRPAVRTFAWAIFAAVVAQGVLGGLRVTGHLTFSTERGATSPNIILAMVHGVFGQMIFASLVALAALRSRAWQADVAPVPSPGCKFDRRFTVIVVLVLILQIVLGALVRHLTWALQQNPSGLAANPEHLIHLGNWALGIHIAVAVVVAMLVTFAGVRAWGLYENVPVLSNLGLVLLALIGVQIALGIGAFVVTGDDSLSRLPTPVDVAVTTSHQVAGAALLATAVLLATWHRRRVTFATVPAAATSEAPHAETARA